MALSPLRLHSALALLVFIWLLSYSPGVLDVARSSAKKVTLEVPPSLPTNAAPPPTDQTNNYLDRRTLIVFTYSESEFGRQNLQFFVDHGLHAAADFVFVLNGDTNVADEIIFKTPHRDRRNVYVRHRENKCFDLGTHAEIFNSVLGGDGWRDQQGPIPVDPGGALKDRYQWFIMMNASLRGPFVPVWGNVCWSDAYLNRITSTVKLVGMTYNCHGDSGHVQSMLWATDKKGLDIILQPEAIGECFTEFMAAVEGEIRTTRLIRENGYEVDSLLTIYHSMDGQRGGTSEANNDSQNRTHDKRVDAGNVPRTPAQAEVPGDFWKTCKDIDYLFPNNYRGTNVQPYETLFVKSQRHLDDLLLERLTEWHNGLGYSSYDYCF